MSEMMLTMRSLLFVVVAVTACAMPDDDEPVVSTVEQGGWNMQGTNLQGWNMQGWNMQGWNMQGLSLQGFSTDGLWLNGELRNARVERGELVAERGANTLRGTAMTGATLYAQVIDADGLEHRQEFRIASITAESASYDPTKTGNTFLYKLEQNVDGVWRAACGVDQDGRSVAIPVAAVFDSSGARVEVPGMFTFGCTTGVIAKCYRWGYKPWLTGYGGADFTDLHWTCTRMARGDYCGNGTPHTRDGTAINNWDRLPYPGPIQKHGLLPPLGMLFEAGWNTGGAVCLSRARWLIDNGLEIANACPDRLVPPALLGATVCDTVIEVLLQDSDALMFNESYLNINLDLPLLDVDVDSILNVHL
jgi:hypothetical protein